jgi:hypothetical protein
MSAFLKKLLSNKKNDSDSDTGSPSNTPQEKTVTIDSPILGTMQVPESLKKALIDKKFFSAIDKIDSLSSKEKEIVQLLNQITEEGLKFKKN